MKYINFNFVLESKEHKAVLASAKRGEITDFCNSQQIPQLEKLLSEGFTIAGTTPLIATWKNIKTGDSYTYTESILFHLIKN